MLVDVGTRRVLALKVTDEKTGDAPVFETLVTEAVAALYSVAARGGGGARGKGAEAAEAEGKEEAAAAIAAVAVRPASEEAAAACAVAADNGGTAREREPEASVSAAAAAAAAEGAKATCADGAYASRKNVAPCRELGIVPFIKMGKNAATAGKGGGNGRGGVARERPGFGTKYVSDLTRTHFRS